MSASRERRVGEEKEEEGAPMNSPAKLDGDIAFKRRVDRPCTAGFIAPNNAVRQITRGSPKSFFNDRQFQPPQLIALERPFKRDAKFAEQEHRGER